MASPEEQDQAPPPASPSKVELDLDDAPFLDDEEEEEELPSLPDEKKEHSADAEEITEEPPQKSGKKKIFLMAGAAGIIVCCALAAWFFLREDTPPPKPPPPPEIKKEEDSPQEEPEALAREERKIIKIEPFFVEYHQGTESRFLECSFMLPAYNLTQNSEIRNHLLEIRDAIYFYLKNKDIFFLENKGNAELFKKDILNVINQHVSSKPVTELLIEKYLVY